jgi:lipopolysaccharide heptosyltransferase I
MSGTLEDLAGLSPRRVCLIKPSSLGDIVHALPVLTILRQHWPEASIAWVVNRSLSSLLDGHPALNEVITYDRGGTHASPAGLSKFAGFLRQLGRGGFDLAIDLQGLLRSGIMALATGAKVRVGLADAREGATRFYTHAVPPAAGPAASIHAVDRLLRLAEVFGADVSAPRFEPASSPADRDWARTVLQGVARPRLVLGLGARWRTKRWPPEHFARIALLAAESQGAGLIAIGTPEDRVLVDDLRRRLGTIAVLDLCGRTTLPQLAAIAAEADLYVGNDSGPLHLAGAAGARVVGLYTCTSPARNGPYGPSAAAIQSRVWCAGSYVKTCDRLDCMRELTPERVWPLVAARLEAATATATATATDRSGVPLTRFGSPAHRGGSR